MSDSLFAELCSNWCMMKPLRGGGCCGCSRLDDSVLEDVEREQRDKERTRMSTQPVGSEQMTVTKAERESEEYYGHARNESETIPVSER